MSGPFCFRSSGVIAPRVLRSSETDPFLPRAETRRDSSAASSAAPSTWVSRSRSMVVRSVMDTCVSREPSGDAARDRQAFSAATNARRLDQPPARGPRMAGEGDAMMRRRLGSLSGLLLLLGQRRLRLLDDGRERFRLADG